MIEIRVLTRGDLAAYRGLQRFGLQERPEAFADTLALDTARPDEEVAAMLSRGEVWGAFVDGRLLAKILLDYPPYPAFAHTRWLHGVYAHPDARGTGVSEALVRAAFDDAREAGARRFLLWVNAANPAARRFYEKLGFRETGRIPEGIRVGERLVDDVLMCLADVG
ncbi:MAG: GNAT family N-acetyltransferase [Terricaulis sp.]